MIENLLDEAAVAYHTSDEQKVEAIISKLVAAGQETVLAMAQALRSDKSKSKIAIRVIHRIGYPQNVSAIPQLIFIIEDSNHPAWEEAIQVLLAMNVDAVIPPLITALLKIGTPYHTDESMEMWSNDVEHICTMLIQQSVPKEYILRCCPAINYLLNQYAFSSGPDPELLLEVAKRAGNQVDYMLPILITISQHFPTVYIRELAKECLSVFTFEQVHPYSLLLT